jgi:glycosyltransferase involved in cell wall biosynthesis
VRIAIVVHGRWDAFDLARELALRNHDVILLTNYPRWATARYGVQPERVRSFWPHGVLSRVVARWGGRSGRGHLEPQLHMLFGRWAAATLRQEPVDVVYAFSGVAEESFDLLAGAGSLRLLVRESAHIRSQDELLHEEELRTGAQQERPSAWMIAREEREYALADSIRVLSTFSHRTFLAQGVPSHKVKLLLSGVQLDAFRPSHQDLEERCRRLTSGERLRVLNVGTFAFRKGVWDTASVIQELGARHFEYRFVGSIAPEASKLAAQLHTRATFVAKQPQSKLPAAYAWGDVFMLPSIEDGYQAVLGQAAAAGLPLLTTPNGAGWDLVRDGLTGWVVPIRSPWRLADALRWADSHRRELAAMARAIAADFRPRDFAQVAEELEHVCAESLGRGVRASPRPLSIA